MSVQKQSDPEKMASLTQAIVKILANEDSEGRKRAIHAALTLLGESAMPTGDESDEDRAAGDTYQDIGSFFKRDGKMKPSDSAFLCAAYHFSQHGSAPFTVDEIRSIAADAGEVIPDRVDVTFRGAAKKGKKLFQTCGKGCFKPTASAAVFFKEAWNVRPGKKPKGSSAAKE